MTTLAESLYPVAPDILVGVTLLSLVIAAALVLVVAWLVPDEWRKRRRIRGLTNEVRELNNDLDAVQRVNRQLADGNAQLRRTVGLLESRVPLAEQRTQRIQRHVPQTRQTIEPTGAMPQTREYRSVSREEVP